MLKAQGVIDLQYFLLAQAKVALSDSNRAVIEYLHQFDERHLRIFAACVIYLSAECLAKRVAGEVVNLQFVALLQLLQDNVDSLDREYAVLLAEQDVAVE